jgi:hypothetical protein
MSITALPRPATVPATGTVVVAVGDSWMTALVTLDGATTADYAWAAEQLAALDSVAETRIKQPGEDDPNNLREGVVIIFKAVADDEGLRGLPHILSNAINAALTVTVNHYIIPGEE